MCFRVAGLCDKLREDLLRVGLSLGLCTLREENQKQLIFCAVRLSWPFGYLMKMRFGAMKTVAKIKVMLFCISENTYANTDKYATGHYHTIISANRYIGQAQYSNYSNN